jgi:hypothetical protein
MNMAVIIAILLIGGAGLFALGLLVGRRSRATVRGFDVVAVHDEKQH